MLVRTILAVAAAFAVLLVLPSHGAEIHRAVEANDGAKVAAILSEDPAAVHSRDDNEFRELPIHHVARSGNIEIARLLLEAGAEIDAGDSDGSTALGVAAMHGQGDMVAWLIAHGADVNRRDRKADCPLSFAVYGRDDAIIQQLLDAGADPYFRNPAGETLMHIACARGVRSLVEQLVADGIDLETAASNGGTPLSYAALRGHLELVEFLLASGANPSPGKPGDMTPLAWAARQNLSDVARVLLQHGADPNALGYQGSTPLMDAAQNGSAELVAVLVEHGARVDHCNEIGESALLKAAAGGHADRMAALLAAGAGADLGRDAVGRTALQRAALGGYPDCARLLLDAGADVSAVSPVGETARDLALYYGHDELGALLEAAGGRPGALKLGARSLAELPRPEAGQALLWFLGHSAWAVKTSNHLLIFDYSERDEAPAQPALCNGHIDPAEIAGENVLVFATHEHGDHFDPVIFDWREQVAKIRYFLGLEPEEAPDYTFLPPGLEQDYGDAKLTSIRATDAGVGILVEVDGVSIFHAGDHANGRLGLMPEFTDEIDWLANKGVRPDIALLGIRGCSLGQPAEVAEGVRYALATLQPRVFIPMHSGSDGHHYWNFIAECRGEFPKVRMIAPDNKGDHFRFQDGRILDPKGADYRRAQVTAAASMACPSSGASGAGS